MNYFLPAAKISRDQGKVFRVGNKFIYPLFHPAAGLRNPAMLTALRASFHKLPSVIKKCKALPKKEIVAKTSAAASGSATSSVSAEEKQPTALF